MKTKIINQEVSKNKTINNVDKVSTKTGIKILGITEGTEELDNRINMAISGYCQDGQLITEAYKKGLDKDLRNNIIDELANTPELLSIILVDLIKAKTNSYGVSEKEIKKRTIFLKKVINLVKDDIFKIYEKKLNNIINTTNQLNLDLFILDK